MAELRGGSTVGGYKIWHAGNFDPNATYSVYPTVVDGNGINTVVSYKRQDGTLYMKSTLSSFDGSGYTVCTMEFYDASGTIIVQTDIWDITYDALGNAVNKIRR